MKPTSPLFCSRTGTALTKPYIRRLLPLLARRAGILKRVHAHGLRHTHSAELRSEGVDIGIVSKQLGHKSITTTACPKGDAFSNLPRSERENREGR